jgi:RNA-directed DNA polymerase
LEDKVKPAVEAFLSERGLSLSQEKTRITTIQKGFDFLGMNIRKYNNGKLIIKPAKSGVKRLLGDIRSIIKAHAGSTTEELIRILNPKSRGWVNYYRHVCSNKTFSYVDHQIFEAIWRWAVRRHKNPYKGKHWIKKKYFHYNGHRNWVFSAIIKKKDVFTLLELVAASQTPIKRHIKIKAAATPFDPAYHSYLSKRISERESAKKSGKKPMWWLCWWDQLKPLKKTDNRIVIEAVL